MLNEVILIGRLTANPETRTVKVGRETKTVLDFTVAVNGFDKDKPADFIPCTVWEQGAEFLDKFASKGDLVSVVGSIKNSTYEDKDGKTVNRLKVAVNRVNLHAPKKGK